MSQWAHYSEKDPEWEEYIPAILARVPPPPKDFSDVVAGRERAIKLGEHQLETGEYPREGYTIKDITIPVEDGEVETRVYIPDSSNPTDTFPVLIDFHGGGGIQGSILSDDVQCRKLCITRRVVVANVNYRHAPEHPWPCGINDGYASVKWISKNISQFQGDVSKGFILCGLSAGALFSAVITQQAREDTDLQGKITGQVLQVPPTLGNGNGYKPEKYRSQLLSYEQNESAALVTPAFIQFYMKYYQPGPDEDLRCSPLLAESFAGLPPAYVQIGGGDLFRDEGLLYAERLKEAGISTKVDVYPGVPHAFNLVMPHIKASKKWDQDLLDGVKWLLELHAEKGTST